MITLITITTIVYVCVVEFHYKTSQTVAFLSPEPVTMYLSSVDISQLKTDDDSFDWKTTRKICTIVAQSFYHQNDYTLDRINLLNPRIRGITMYRPTQHANQVDCSSVYLTKRNNNSRAFSEFTHFSWQLYTCSESGHFPPCLDGGK